MQDKLYFQIRAKVRQASIADTPALRILPKSSVSMRSSENSTPQLSFASHGQLYTSKSNAFIYSTTVDFLKCLNFLESNSRNQSDSLNNIYSSRRSSLDNSLIWMNTSPGLMKGQFGKCCYTNGALSCLFCLFVSLVGWLNFLSFLSLLFVVQYSVNIFVQ